MKITENLIAVVKNMANLSHGFVLVPGKRQMAISPSDSILVEVDFDEPVENEFAVHDEFISSFLSTMNLFKGGDLEFTNDSAIMKNGSLSMSFRSAEAKLIKRPKDTIEIPDSEVDVEFSVRWDDINQAISLANINSLENLSVVGENGKLILKVHNRKNVDSNKGSFEIGETDKDFSAHFLTSDLKFLNGDYNVKMALGKFSIFTNISTGERLIKYAVAEQY